MPWGKGRYGGRKSVPYCLARSEAIGDGNGPRKRGLPRSWRRRITQTVSQGIPKVGSSFARGGRRRVIRIEPDGTTTVVASQYHGRRLNRPNDVVVKSDGSIYFNDPGGPSPDTDLDYSGVYRVSQDLGDINLLVRDYVLPNGLAFSPDESVLYINDSLGLLVRDDMFRSLGRIDAFDVRANGMLANRRVFCELRGESSGIPDGMKVDVEGNVYCTGPGGVWVMDPTGKHLGTILTEVEHTTNMAWGGEDWKTLFITTFETLARIDLKIAGIPVPAQVY